MNQKTKGEQAKEKLIECAAKLFLLRGYSATGINDILAATSMTKGSFYFYFSSKKELAIKVSEFYRENLKKWLQNKAKDNFLGWEAFITALIEDKINDAKGKNYFGCPIAVLGSEIAFLEPDIAEKYTEIFKGLINLFFEVLIKSGMTEEKAHLLAKRAFIVYEGHLLFYRISKNISELELLKDELINLYRFEKGVLNNNEREN